MDRILYGIQATGRELTTLAMPTYEDFSNNIPCPDTATNAMQNYNHLTSWATCKATTGKITYMTQQPTDY